MNSKDKLGPFLRVVLLLAAMVVTALSVHSQRAAFATGCLDSQCIGGDVKCATLPDGTICWTGKIGGLE